MDIQHTIDIVIGEDGKFIAEIKGVTGPACSDISKFLDSLGQVEKDQHTPDYFRPAKQGLTVTAK